MEIIYNNIIPFKGFIAINLFGFLFVRKKLKCLVTRELINHEEIHTAQMRELFYIGFYIWYLIEWILRLILVKDSMKAYKMISFEVEAYKEQDNLDYLRNRKHFSWYEIFKKI